MCMVSSENLATASNFSVGLLYMLFTLAYSEGEKSRGISFGRVATCPILSSAL